MRGPARRTGVLWGRMAGRVAGWWGSRRWPPFSRLLLVDDGADWVLAQEMAEIGPLVRRLGFHLEPGNWVGGVRRQGVHYASQFAVLGDRWWRSDNRSAFSYYHGDPGLGDPAFARLCDGFRRRRDVLARVHVSNTAFREVALSTGIPPDRVQVIPIGINPGLFPPATPESRRKAREQLGLPAEAVVVGSFQKDGQGWGEGGEPKLIKGPDRLVEALGRMHGKVPELWVLLSGPARGYVRSRLEQAGIPYRHRVVDYREMSRLYHALDLYLITSREEGGPKALLEAMACGVPVVTTRVGQAVDLIRSGENGWMAGTGEVDEFVHLALGVLADLSGRKAILERALRTARENRYETLLPRWGEFYRRLLESE